MVSRTICRAERVRLACIALSASALAAVLLPVKFATPAEAKTPGSTYCYYGVCHRVKTIEETQGARRRRGDDHGLALRRLQPRTATIRAVSPRRASASIPTGPTTPQAPSIPTAPCCWCGARRRSARSSCASTTRVPTGATACSTCRARRLRSSASRARASPPCGCASSRRRSPRRRPTSRTATTSRCPAISASTTACKEAEYGMAVALALQASAASPMAPVTTANAFAAGTERSEMLVAEAPQSLGRSHARRRPPSRRSRALHSLTLGSHGDRAARCSRA